MNIASTSVGYDREHQRRRDLSVLDSGGGDEGERADGHRLDRRRSEDQRKDEVVPGEDEGQQRPPRRCRAAPAGWRSGRRCCSQLWPASRYANSISGADVLEIAPHDPEDQRQRDELVDPDQSDISVVESHALEIERQRQQHRERRREAERQERERDVLAEPELVAGESVGGRHAEDQRQNHRTAGQQGAVAEIEHEGDLRASRRSAKLAG